MNQRKTNLKRVIAQRQQGIRPRSFQRGDFHEFLADCVDLHQDHKYEATADVYNAYCQYCQTKNWTPYSRTQFGIHLCRLNSVHKSRIRIGGELAYVYNGLQLKQAG